MESAAFYCWDKSKIVFSFSVAVILFWDSILNILSIFHLMAGRFSIPGRLYHQQSMAEKRRLLQFVHSNSIWKDGRLYPKFRKPFDIIADTNLAYNKKRSILLWRTTFLMFGSPARTWTADLVVNSHSLCQLSYWGAASLNQDSWVIYQPKFFVKQIQQKNLTSAFPKIIVNLNHKNE